MADRRRGGVVVEVRDAFDDLQRADRRDEILAQPLAQPPERRRFAAGLAPYAVVACDNLADNGWRLKAAVVAFAAESILRRILSGFRARMAAGAGYRDEGGDQPAGGNRNA